MNLSCASQAFEDGFTQDDVFEYTKMDPWFLAQFWEMHQAELWLKTQKLGDISAFDMLQTKKRGFSDSQIGRFTGTDPSVRYTVCIYTDNIHYARVGWDAGVTLMPVECQDGLKTHVASLNLCLPLF